MKQVVVVGGGIAGLAAAYELNKGGAKVTVIEAGPRLGGVVETHLDRGYLIEYGPDSFLSTKPGATGLCRELGLEDRIVPSMGRRVYVASGGKLHALPEGMFLTVPTRVWPFLKSGLFSWLGKLRMGMDLVLPRGDPGSDESIGSFVRRRLGREALEKVAEPLMAGIYMSDADELSIRATFPRFLDMERDHRSLIKALRKIPTPAGAVSPFVTLRGGMSVLIETLVAAMPGVTFRTHEKVTRLDREADAVVLAIPAPHAAELVEPQDRDLSVLMREIPHAACAVVSLGYPRSAVSRELDGTGFVIPKAERRTLLACTWTSSKFPDRAPEGRILMRAFIPDPVKDVDRLLALVREELAERMGLQGEPEVVKTRFIGANPVYKVGHQERIRTIDERTRKIPGLFLTGSSYRGIGLPDVITDARATARQVLKVL